MEKSEVPISKEYLQYKRNYAHNTAAVESAPCAKVSFVCCNFILTIIGNIANIFDDE